MTSLTVIVPATNDPPTLTTCTDAIRIAGNGPEQLIVVRDADRPGPAAARNAGALEASGDVLVFVADMNAINEFEAHIETGGED